ncbi:terminase [Bacillus thuringiensis]|uniref:terminase n=1 Tax=Bacillus thuringiensis TaxID=1428 RepID=UPI0028BE5066|nr:terminase [Bacillus thuringiensis]
MAVSIVRLKEQLMNSVDTTDLVEVEKVERYIDLVKAFRKINKTITKEGESVTIKNGTQVFVKAHPLISERFLFKSIQLLINFVLCNSKGKV